MSFQLAHFAIGEGANVALLLHGALGSGQNFRSLAKRLQRAYPSWKFVCADLRHHGASHPAPGPNTLASCTNDLQRLAGLAGDPQVVIGHSFGGEPTTKLKSDFSARVLNDDDEGIGVILLALKLRVYLGGTLMMLHEGERDNQLKR